MKIECSLTLLLPTLQYASETITSKITVDTSKSEDMKQLGFDKCADSPEDLKLVMKSLAKATEESVYECKNIMDGKTELSDFHHINYNPYTKDAKK